MNQRVLLSVRGGVLLALPLVLLLGTLLLPEPKSVDPPGERISPVLDMEQRTRLRTYWRDCESSAECEPLLGCL